LTEGGREEEEFFNHSLQERPREAHTYPVGCRRRDPAAAREGEEEEEKEEEEEERV